MPGEGFEPTIPVFERPKTVRALGCAAIGAGITATTTTTTIIIIMFISQFIYTAAQIV
jgi:hypothetical protein